MNKFHDRIADLELKGETKKLSGAGNNKQILKLDKRNFSNHCHSYKALLFLYFSFNYIF